MGGLLTLTSFVKTFPEIDTTTATETAQHLNASQQTHRSTIQGTPVQGSYRAISRLTGSRYFGRCLQRRMFLWGYCYDLYWRPPRSPKDNLSRLFDHGCWCSFAVLVFFVSSIHHWKISHWVRTMILLERRMLTLNESFGNGLNTSTVPTWQSECSRSHRRGQLVMIEVFRPGRCSISELMRLNS